MMSKNKAIVLITLAVTSIIAITLICIWPAQKQPTEDPARNGANSDIMEDNSRFSLINLHWQYQTHAYVTSGAILLAAIIALITCFIKARLKKKKAKKRRPLPDFRSSFLPQASQEYEMGVMQYNPWPAPPAWAPPPPGSWPAAPPPGPSTWAPPYGQAHGGLHPYAHGGPPPHAHGGPGGQAPQYQGEAQQAQHKAQVHAVAAVAHQAPPQLEYLPESGNISPEYEPAREASSPEVEILGMINTPPAPMQDNNEAAPPAKKWRN